MSSALRRPAAVGVLIALLFLGAWWKLLWEPQGSALAKARSQTAAASTNLYSVEQNIGHLKHLQLISPKLAALEQKVSDAAPTNDQVDQFVLTLNALAQQANVGVGAISLTQPAAVPGSLSTIGVHLSVSGDYFAVEGFLDALRAASRVVIVDSLAEAPQQKNGKNSGVSATLGLHLLTGLSGPAPAVQTLLTPPTTAAPNGTISGPVTKAKNAVAGANANTATINKQANSVGAP
jgi:Tfp pilus assembly protein PilO